ncbi:hypothetical protein HD599_002634 [Conyzicola lurida]|uniref:Uncharacterized protein n=1 Tax=Conyzicola lurida TaxID=1172621 RepID=A0A841ARA9_9MICO|nr:hypothetical protein [Conyzicola lurida]MBB5844311.1 hypothetical protein [Conyzicola lurida]
MTPIQQRIAIDRARTLALWMLGVGGIATVLTALQAALSPPDPLRWAMCALWVVLGVLGVIRLLAARRRRVAFEAEHGRDAGRQEPIRRA